MSDNRHLHHVIHERTQPLETLPGNGSCFMRGWDDTSPTQEEVQQSVAKVVQEIMADTSTGKEDPDDFNWLSQQITLGTSSPSTTANLEEAGGWGDGNV